MTANSTDPMIGRLVDGRYQVRSRIARGGMATVYLATDLRLERRVALKIMHGHLADDSQFKERFIQEARSAARLAHPNVVNVYDQGQDSDMAYLVMEYLPGITLRDLMQEHGRLTTDQTLDVLEAVLSGLAAAHKAGIVHRDLKPENVLLADDGRIKIGDFGLARAASANTATGAALLGTIAYLSPELVTRGIADARSDIYAVGIMMYEMLTGEQPFKGEQPMQIAYQHANDSVPTPSSKNSRVPVELDELVLWATAREPDERPRDARVMLEQLQETQSLLGTSAATSATTVQRTAVYQPSLPIRGATAETAVLRGRARTPEAVAAPTTSTSVLAAKAQKRRARGWWLFGLVILLAALAGGTGWYFGAGPGAQATVPDVAGRSVEAATTLLTDQGFRVASTVADVHDPVVDRGLVSRTTPQAGASVSKGAVITLKKSIGPALIALPTLIGIPEQQAKDAITKARFVNAAKSIQQFDNKVALGTVIDALDNNGKSLAGRSTYSEQRQITLVVSAGRLPQVTGLSYADAAARVTAAGLTPQPGSQIYNAKVDKNLVIEIERDKNSSGVTQPIRVGESVSLTISRGPEMVVIPNVIGDTWLVAKQKLIDAGFTNLNYNKKADAAPSVVTVDTVTPNVGQKVAKGSTLTITFTI